MPVRVGACRALVVLFARAHADAIRPHLPALYAAAGQLLAASTEQTLHLVLETLLVLIQADEATAAQNEAALSGARLCPSLDPFAPSIQMPCT
jgi:hypothetical protein